MVELIAPISHAGVAGVEFIDPVFAVVTSAVLFAVWVVMVWLDQA